MSFQLFKTELKAKLGIQHSDRAKLARVLALGYDKLANRHFDIITGGGKLIASSVRVPALQIGIQTVLERNLASSTRINFFNDISPFIKSYWAGMLIIGGTGQVIISNTGVFKGPPVVENNSIDIWLNIFQGVASIHLLTMTGTYTNYYTGVTVPWSSASLKSIP
jgi:hypothetical protein